jgi:hypothetical protein
LVLTQRKVITCLSKLLSANLFNYVVFIYKVKSMFSAMVFLINKFISTI